MPRKLKIEAEEEQVQEVEVSTVPVHAPLSDPNVKLVELNGRIYNEIFNPLDGTTKRVPLNPVE